MIPTALLPHRITVERYAGSSAYGPVYGAAVKMRARVTPKRRMVTTSTGDTVVADATVLIRPCREIPTESRVTHHGRTYLVAGVTDAAGLDEPHHSELILTGPRPEGAV